MMRFVALLEITLKRGIRLDPVIMFDNRAVPNELSNYWRVSTQSASPFFSVSFDAGRSRRRERVRERIEMNDCDGGEGGFESGQVS